MKHYIYLTLFLSLVACRSSFVVSDEKVDRIRIADAEVTQDQSIDLMIAPYRQEASTKMDQVIGTLDTELTKQSLQSTLGNWLADMMYDELREVRNLDIDLAIQNQGGVRVNSIGAGPITIGEVFEVMPFDNLVSIVTLDATGVQELLNHIAKDGGWPISRTVNMEIKDDSAVNVTIHGDEINKEKLYKVAMPDYIANGGSGTNFLAGKPRYDLGILIREVFINHIKRETAEGKTQSAQLDNRIYRAQ